MTRGLSWILGTFIALALSSAAGCSDSKGNTCDTSGQQTATLEVGCHGSAKSCRSIGISTDSEGCVRTPGRLRAFLRVQ